MKNKIHIHPLTIPIFVLVYFTPFRNRFFILYIFIFLHELSHAFASLLTGEKIASIRLLPWGCMLSLSTVPDKRHALVIFSAGPLFNLLMLLAGIFPNENASLALFNLMPVAPLDGGIILNLLFPRAAFCVSVAFIILLTAFFVYSKTPPFVPIALALILYIGRRNSLDKKINLKIIRHFSEKN